MNNLWASFQIFVSNFRASFGWYINIMLILAIAGAIGLLFLRAYLRGREEWGASLEGIHPEAVLTAKAAARLSGMIRFPTVTGDQGAMENQLAYLKSVYAPVLRGLGFLEMPNGSMLLRWKSREKTDALPVLFCGHLDVVPPGEGWNHNPFGGKRREGYIYGRGAFDCKGSIIAMLDAVESLMEEGYAPRREIYFAFGHDEETGGLEGAAEIADLMQRRGLVFDMIVDEGGYIAADYMGRTNCAAALIGLGEKPACRYKITVTTPGGHAGIIPNHTTLGILSEAICRIEAAQPHLKITPVTAEYLRKSSPAMSFGKRFVLCNLPLTRPFVRLAFGNDRRTLSMLRTTLAPTGIEAVMADSVIPAEASAIVEARLLPGDTAISYLDLLQSLLGDLHANVRILRHEEHVPLTNVDHPMYLLLQRTLEERFPKLPCIPTLVTGSADSQHYAAMCDCIVRFSPFIMTDEDMAGVHGPDEVLSERALGLGVEFYRALLKKL